MKPKYTQRFLLKASISLAITVLLVANSLAAATTNLDYSKNSNLGNDRGITNNKAKLFVTKTIGRLNMRFEDQPTSNIPSYPGGGSSIPSYPGAGGGTDGGDHGGDGGGGGGEGGGGGGE